MTTYNEPLPQLSVGARRVENVEKWRISSRDEWLGRRNTLIGASEVAALFNVHAYYTPAQLFAMKRGEFNPEVDQAVLDENSIYLPPIERGLLLEDDALELVARIKPAWRVQPNPVPGGWNFRHPKSRLASTPDAFVYAPGEDGPGCVQVKTVAEPVYKSRWVESGVPTVPVGVGVQLNIDAALSGCSWGYIVALIVGGWGSLECRLFRITISPALFEKARERVDEFWHRVAENRPYDFDYGRDGRLIASLYSEDDGSTVDLGDDHHVIDLLAERERLKAIEKSGGDAEKARKPLDAELVARLGNASAGRLADGRLITAKTVRRAAYEAKASTYRLLKVVGGAGGVAPARGRAAASGAMPEMF